MAKSNSTRTPARAASAVCGERRIKVYQSYYESRATRETPSQRASRTVPWVQLKGDWLAHAGFAIHALLKVRVMRGCLVVTVEEPTE
jgi:hypothetical protein